MSILSRSSTHLLEPDMSDHDQYQAGRDGLVGDMSNPHYALGLGSRNQQRQAEELAAQQAQQAAQQQARMRNIRYAGNAGVARRPRVSHYSKAARTRFIVWFAVAGFVASGAIFIPALMMLPDDSNRLWRSVATVVAVGGMGTFLGAAMGNVASEIPKWAYAVLFALALALALLCGGFYLGSMHHLHP